MRPGSRPRDLHAEALAGVMRSRMEPDADEYGGPSDMDADDMHRRALAEDETMLPGGRMVPIDDIEMTDDLWRKTRPDVAAEHFGAGRDRFIEENVPEELAGDEALTARVLDEYRRRGGR